MRPAAPPPIHRFVPQTGDALPVELQRLDSRHVLHDMALHGHTFFELILFEQSGGPHRLGARTHPTDAGTLALIRPGELHDCSALGPLAKGWVLLFTHEALDGLSASSRAYSEHWPTGNPLLSPFLSAGRRVSDRLVVPSGDLARWSERFRAMALEFAHCPPGYRQGVQAYLQLVLLDVLRIAQGSGGAPARSAPDPMLQAAFGFIERSFARPISARDVAAAVGRSVAHVTTAMRVRTGLTAGEWISERRMAEARRLLAGSALDLDTIAEQVGYSGGDGLSRAFRRTHRLTPAAWRQAHRGLPPYA